MIPFRRELAMADSFDGRQYIAVAAGSDVIAFAIQP